MANNEILSLYRQLQECESIDSQFPSKIIESIDLLKKPNARPNSFSIEDAFFGDSGKGSVVAKFNHLLSQKSPVISLRWNGGANAGHETYADGKKIVTHQLPMGVIEEEATAIISRGMVVHPEDLLTEIDIVSSQFIGYLPGNLIIDERAILALDTHRALEHVYKKRTTGSNGSTGRGISSAYASVYERNSLTFKDFLSDDWERIFTDHYTLYQDMIDGLGVDLADSPVKRLIEGGEKLVLVGDKQTFLYRLRECRNAIREKGYVKSNVRSIIENAWKDPSIPFTLEGAQGPGLDPFHGVSPDNTASRPMSRNINDATYNEILPEDINWRLAVFKTTYTSSVGDRKLPFIDCEDHRQQAKWVQKAFDETGRTSGRLRDVYPVSLPIAQYLKRAAGYDFLIATHLDAARVDKPIQVVTHYYDKYTCERKPYSPYQDELDKLIPSQVQFPGWDGEAIKRITDWNKLPDEAKKYLLFLSKTIAPIIMATNGADLHEYFLLNPAR